VEGGVPETLTAKSAKKRKEQKKRRVRTGCAGFTDLRDFVWRHLNRDDKEHKSPANLETCVQKTNRRERKEPQRAEKRPLNPCPDL
jgi:hypothetical protein